MLKCSIRWSKNCFCFSYEVDRFTLKGALRDATADLDDFIKNIK